MTFTIIISAIFVGLLWYLWMDIRSDTEHLRNRKDDDKDGEEQ